MSVDVELADRVRQALAGRAPVREVRMFGGLAFMVDERMVVCVRSDRDLLVRADPERADELLALPGARSAEMGAGSPDGPELDLGGPGGPDDRRGPAPLDRRGARPPRPRRRPRLRLTRPVGGSAGDPRGAGCRVCTDDLPLARGPVGSLPLSNSRSARAVRTAAARGSDQRGARRLVGLVQGVLREQHPAGGASWALRPSAREGAGWPCCSGGSTCSPLWSRRRVRW